MPSFDYDDPQAWSHGTYAVASEIGEDVEIKMPPATKVGDTLWVVEAKFSKMATPQEAGSFYAYPVALQ